MYCNKSYMNVVTVSGDPLLESSTGSVLFWCSTLPSIGTYFLFMFSIHKFNAFPILTKQLSHTAAVTFAV